jgi:hypothetical protein
MLWWLKWPNLFKLAGLPALFVRATALVLFELDVLHTNMP